jgi:transcriptional regulator with XRE-family HTH domain
MLAFGRAIHLLRRQQAMTVEKLAESAQIDLGELVKIENDPHHRAEPRAVSQLARIFRQDPKTFQQLAGNAMVRDRRMVEEAERFAARSGSIEKLSSQERQALEHFIAALGALSEKRSKPKP